MPQLVGQSCAICGERIGSELESGFCKTCGNAVHNRCRKPGAPTWTICPECGTDKEAAAKRAEELERQRREETARRSPPPPLEIDHALHAYQIGRWLLGAAGAIFLGVLAFAADEPAAGFGAIAAGIGITVVGVFVTRSR